MGRLFGQGALEWEVLWGLIHPGSFQYGAQTEKLQQQLASEKGVHPEVRFHVSLAQIWGAGPWGLLESPQKTAFLPPTLTGLWLSG